VAGNAGLLDDRAVTRIRGLELSFVFLPGAYAPSFMLAPASQAQPDVLSKPD